MHAFGPNNLKGKLLERILSTISIAVMGGQTKPKKQVIFFLWLKVQTPLALPNNQSIS